MVANLGLVLVAVSSPFVLFILVLAYGAWTTQEVKLTGSTATA